MDQMYRVMTILHKVHIVLYAQLLYSIAQLLRNAQSYDSCAVMTLTVHVSCTYWGDRYYRVHLYLIMTDND